MGRGNTGGSIARRPAVGRPSTLLHLALLGPLLASAGCEPGKPTQENAGDEAPRVSQSSPAALPGSPLSATASASATPGSAPPSSSDPAQLDAALQRTPLDVDLWRRRVERDLERGDSAEAHRSLNIALYTLAQADALPSVDAWLPLIRDHYGGEARAADGSRLLVMLRRFYTASPEVDRRLLGYLRAEGRDDDVRAVLEEAVDKFPEDPRWAEELAALR